MKKIGRIILAFSTVIALMTPGVAAAQSLSDILGGLGSAASGVVEGLFTKTNLSVDDIVGEWKGNGPAVSFKDDNFLKKAGGAAMSGVVEDKLAPYYKQFGLNNIDLTVDANGNFKMSMKLLTLSGTLTSNGDGTFEFKFKALGSINLGSMKAYVQKSGNNLSLMFDATKMMSLITSIAKFTKIKLADTVAGILNSYDGLCVGFKMSRVGEAPASSSNSIGSSVEGALENLFGGSKSTTKSTGTDNKTTTKSTDKTSSSEKSSILDKLKSKNSKK